MERYRRGLPYASQEERISDKSATRSFDRERDWSLASGGMASTSKFRQGMAKIGD